MTKRSELPFVNPVADSLDLMKKMWGLAGLPGIPSPGNLATMAARIPQTLPNMLAPTLDVDELEKRIADLRTVEQWLQMNASILRTTIQSLEVQRATISTLKGISGVMMAPMLKKAPPNAPPEVTLGLAAMKEDESKAAMTAPLPELPRRAMKGRSQRTESSAEPPPMIAATALNPAAWWTALQDQFARVSASALEESAPKAAPSPPSSSRPRRRAAKSRKTR